MRLDEGKVGIEYRIVEISKGVDCKEDCPVCLRLRMLEFGDMHYVRQGKVLDGMDIKDYTQHQIEYLHPQINEGGIWESPSSNLDYSIKGALVDNQKVMDYLPLLGELGIHLSGWDGHFFCSTYQLVLRNLKGGHHRGDSKRLRLLVEGHYPSIGRRIRDWVWEDIKRFGYGDIL